MTRPYANIKQELRTVAERCGTLESHYLGLGDEGKAGTTASLASLLREAADAIEELGDLYLAARVLASRLRNPDNTGQ